MWFIGVEEEQERSAPPPKKILDPPLLQYLIFPKIIDASWLFTKVRIFNYCSSLYHILESENFRFPFSSDKKPNLRGEMWKIELQKFVVNLLDKHRKLYMNGKVI